MTVAKWVSIVIGSLVLLYLAMKLYFMLVVNPRVVEELKNNPEGDRAGIVMLLSMAPNEIIPVNYLLESDTVFVGSDGLWWRDFREPGMPVTMLIRGRTVNGHGIAVLDDQAYVDDVFSRLRPTVPEWLPDWLNGKLVKITLDQKESQE